MDNVSFASGNLAFLSGNSPIYLSDNTGYLVLPSFNPINTQEGMLKSGVTSSKSIILINHMGGFLNFLKFMWWIVPAKTLLGITKAIISSLFKYKSAYLEKKSVASSI